MDTVLEYAISNGAGLFALLFIALLAWVLRTNDSREMRYLNVIDCLGEKIDGKVDNLGVRVGCLEKDVSDIKREVMK